jgi:hypothetical protein
MIKKMESNPRMIPTAKSPMDKIPKIAPRTAIILSSLKNAKSAPKPAITPQVSQKYDIKEGSKNSIDAMKNAFKETIINSTPAMLR